LEETGERYAEDLREILEVTRGLRDLTEEFLEQERLDAILHEPDGVPNAARLRHDLRTPLNAIRGYAELLADESEDAGDHRLRADLGRIVAAVEQMVAGVDRILHPAGLGVAPEPKTVDPGFAALVEDAVDTLESLGGVGEKFAGQGSVLVVDDNEHNRYLLVRQLGAMGYEVEVAENGRRALEMLRSQDFDVVLLDVIMPEMNGYQVLLQLKADERLRQIPVIMVSAFDDLESVVRCIELGADEYLPKTFDPVLLRARLAASLERKRLRDREKKYLDEIQREREKSERLLLSILPGPIAERLKRGEQAIADDLDDVTVLFCDLVGFTEFSARRSASAVVGRLNEIFQAFDRIVEQHGLEKIKTIGDAYLLAGGLPQPRPDHAASVADAALAMIAALRCITAGHGDALEARIGIHTGPAVAGVIGTKRFTYDLWGDTVNIASRMESRGLPGRIQISTATRQRLGDEFLVEERGPIRVKGLGRVVAYFLNARGSR
jgi:class 3 adenylate cyclase